MARLSRFGIGALAAAGTALVVSLSAAAADPAPKAGAIATATATSPGKLAHEREATAGAPPQWMLIDKYCAGCHNVEDWAGGVAFDSLDPHAIPQDAETWEKVVNRLRGRLMPPPGEPRPDTKTLDTFVGWVEGNIDAAAAKEPEPGYVLLHRLNRKEYANAVRYLLDVDTDPTSLLPQDEVSDGFDNIANVLQVSPSFLDQYFSAARNMALLAVGNPGSRPVGVPYVSGGKQQTHIEGLPLGTRGGLLVEHSFPADGEYELNIGDLARALWVEGMEFDNTLIATLDGVKFFETKLGGNDDQKAIDQKGDPSVDAINKRLKNIRFKAKAGQHKVGVTFLARTFAESDSRLASLVPGGGEERVLKIRNFEVRGPFTTEGVSDTASRKRIFTCYPQSEAAEDACARQIVDTLGRRAYRRPLTDSDRSVIMKSYATARAGATFDAGIRGAVTRILASPDFLYRIEAVPADAKPGTTYRINDFELASRLSFFLWSNVPDDELLDLAQQGRLNDDAVLEQQVRRMVKDPKATALAYSFAYQWLGLGKLADIEPDPLIFPYVANHRDLDGDIREGFREEIRLFVDDVFRNDRSVLDLLNGRYTFLNEPLALHYGITAVKGDAFRRVELTDPARFGLLGKAGVLMVSSYPNRTAPVLRGAWILETLNGVTPTPPPPNVEALKDNEVGKQALTLRELMERHRSAKSCFSCHGVMDPLGLALENFDGTGRWRDKDRLAQTVIDASGVLPDGTPITGPVDLQKSLVARPDQFVQTLTQKLMTYGIGRTMEYKDKPTVRAITRDAAAHGYHFVPLVIDIVKSAPFRMKRVPFEEKALPAQKQAATTAPAVKERGAGGVAN